MCAEANNLAGVEFYEITDLSIREYHAGAGGKGAPEELLLWIELAGLPLPLVMRFKTAEPVDALIESLTVHRNHVWGKETDHGE